MLSDPLAVRPTEAASSLSLIANYADAQRQFANCAEKFVALSNALRESWPGEWHGTSQESYLRDHVGNFEAVAETMRVSADLTWENLKEGNEALRADINALENLLQQAREFAGTPRGTGRGEGRRDRGSGRPPGGDDKEAALRYFGFSSTHPPASKRNLREAWKRKIKVLHPDANPGATDAELAGLREEWNRCQRFYDVLLIHFSWH
jgi:hypothetical protein